MRKLVVGLLGVFLSTVVHGEEEIPYLAKEYDPSKWPQAVLKLSKAATLKDFFDSGLRPYRHPGLERTTLEVKHLNLLIQLASGKNLPLIPTELINIKMFADGNISTFEGFTPKLTLEEARTEMMKWLPYSINGRTEADLNTYLKKVEADYIDFDDPYRGDPSGYGIGWYEPGWKTRGGGPQCGLGFRKTASLTHPLRLYFGFDWGLNRPSKEARSYRVPIPPPPGYEHVSMEAPENFGPDSMDDILRSKGVDIGESKEAVRENKVKNEAPVKDAEAPDADSSETSDAPDPQNPSHLRWFIGGFVLLVILLLCKTRNDRSAR